jgi:hypothetical protein
LSFQFDYVNEDECRVRHVIFPILVQGNQSGGDRPGYVNPYRVNVRGKLAVGAKSKHRYSRGVLLRHVNDVSSRQKSPRIDLTGNCAVHENQNLFVGLF